MLRLKRLLAAGILWMAAAGSFGAHFEAGSINIPPTSGTSWTSVSFTEAFDGVPVVVTTPTTNGSDPATLRVRNVTSTGFEVTIVEPEGNDGPHAEMQVGYVALDQGVHPLPGGGSIAAFTHSTRSFVSKFIGRSWSNVTIPGGFATTPTVITQIQTALNETGAVPGAPSIPFIETAMRNLGPASLQVSLERAETTTATIPLQETIGFIALAQNTVATMNADHGGTVVLQAMTTPRNVRGWNNGCVANPWPQPFGAAPIAVASMVTRFGGDGGWVRACSATASSYSLTIDEDIAADTDRSHTTEQVATVGVSGAFHTQLGGRIRVGKRLQTLSDTTASSQPKNIPGALVQYTIRVTNEDADSPDANSMTIVDELPPELALCVQASCFAGAPVTFDGSGLSVPGEVSVDQVRYSNDGGSTFTYVPTADADGFDANVNAVQITTTGTLSAASGASAFFELAFVAKVR